MSPELESLLLSMCEDVAVRRADLLTLLETCELHHKTSMLPPAERLIKQLVDDVCRNSVRDGISFWVSCLFEVLLGSLNMFHLSPKVDLVSMAENGSPLTDRSQVVRDRLHSKKQISSDGGWTFLGGVYWVEFVCFSGSSFSNSTWSLKQKIPRTYSGVCYPSETSGYVTLPIMYLLSYTVSEGSDLQWHRETKTHFCAGFPPEAGSGRATLAGIIWTAAPVVPT